MAKKQEYQSQAMVPTGFKRVLLVIFSLFVILFLTGSYALVSMTPTPTPTPTLPAVIIPTTSPEAQVSAQPQASPEAAASPTATPQQ